MAGAGLGALAAQLREGKEYHYSEEHEVPRDILKYWHRRYDVFSRYDEGIKLTDKSWFGITPEPIANKIAAHMAAAAPSHKTTLIDAFCGAGGNAVAFALSGRWERIFAIEKDPEELKCAKKNAEIYGVSKKIFFVQGDCFEVVSKRFSKIGKEAVLFGSPPWGGPKYTGDEVFDLSKMQPYSLKDLHTGFSKYFSEVVLFLPRSSNLNQIATLVEQNEQNEQIQVAHYCMGGFSKALCSYHGQFRTLPVDDPE